MRFLRIVRRHLGSLVLAGAMGFSAFKVMLARLTYEDPDVRTIRICHWQLETGFRDALQQLIEEYETLHRAGTGERVRIVQIPVASRGYAQYVNTGMVGGTAPDIVEKGFAKTAVDPSYVARFYAPLARHLSQPNPYNIGTPLEGVPWRETFIDGMASCFDSVLGDYYYVPFSIFTVRIYYNMDLFEEATGSRKPPADYAGFMNSCGQIREYGRRNGLSLVPIAGSKTQMASFRVKVEQPFMHSLVDMADINDDEYADPVECYLAYRNGGWNFTHPALGAAWKCMAEIGAQCQDGWQAADRNDAIFMFSQQQAAMYASGSWDSAGISRQVAGRFELGVMDFPLPTDHPEYGPFVAGPTTEANVADGIPWAINIRTREMDLCLDFLRFCTTRANNERFNDSITWMPVVRGARINEWLKPFKPRVQGLYGRFDYYSSTTVRLIGEANCWSLYGGAITPADYAGRLESAYERTARDGCSDWVDSMRQRGRNAERVLAGLRLQALAASPEDSAELSAKAMQILQPVCGFNGLVSRYAVLLSESNGKDSR